MGAGQETKRNWRLLSDRRKENTKERTKKTLIQGMKDHHEIPFYFKVVELEAAGDITDRTVRVLTPQDKSIGPISTCVAVV